ncbi:MAG: alpha/beta hydrolase [Candidatus Hodarchaeales archaeon]
MTDFEIISPEFHYEGTSGTGCLLIHGFTASPTEMKPIGNYLKEKTDHEILAIRLTDHGTSPEEMASTKHADWIDDVCRGFDRLAQNNSKIIVIGFSLGALLSVILCSKRKVTGLLLLCPPFFVQKRLMALAPVLKYFVKSIAKSPETAEFYKKHGLISYMEYPLAAVQEFNIITKKAKKVAKEIDVPILGIFSEKDDLVSTERARKFFERNIHANIKELLMLKESKHIITVDSEVDTVLNGILTFIDKII